MGEADGMKRLDIKAMTDAMRTIKAICDEYHGKGCGAFCPANGHGRLCHSGDISCRAPHRWWGIKLDEEASNE